VKDHQILAFSILSKFLTFKALTMSSFSSNANPNPVPAVEPTVWRTTFKVNGRPVTIEDIVMDNEDTAVAVARDMILPRDEIMLAARTDIEAVNQSLALSVRATSSFVNIAERLHARRLELNTQVLDLHHQIENLRNRLRDERRHRNNLERRNQELNARVDFWRDYVNTRHLEFEEEMERMRKQFEEFRGMIDHQDENIPNRPRTV
jgi:chromosome segregation ATPase